MVKGGRRWWTSDGIAWNGGERGEGSALTWRGTCGLQEDEREL